MPDGGLPFPNYVCYQDIWLMNHLLHLLEGTKRFIFSFCCSLKRVNMYEVQSPKSKFMKAVT